MLSFLTLDAPAWPVSALEPDASVDAVAQPYVDPRVEDLYRWACEKPGSGWREV